MCGCMSTVVPIVMCKEEKEEQLYDEEKKTENKNTMHELHIHAHIQKKKQQSFLTRFFFHRLQKHLRNG